MLQFYNSKILKLHCASVRGRKILAKPILILAIIHSIENHIILNNEFPWGKQKELLLEFNHIYEDLFIGYLPNEYHTPLFKPFFHLKHEGFWHLKLNEDVKFPTSSSVGFLNKYVDYAYLDNELWELLQNFEYRKFIKETIIHNYLMN